MTSMKLFEAIGCNNLDDVIPAIRDGCNINQCISADFIYQNTKNEIFKDIIMHLMNANGKRVCISFLTPLMCALIFPSIDIKIIKSLIVSGADVNYCPVLYTNLLFFVLDRKFETYALVELLSNGANVNQYDDDGISPLMFALRNKCDNEVIEKLLLFGADVNSRSCDFIRRKPLMFVSCWEKKTVSANFFYCNKVCPNRKNVTTLLNYGADVNSTDSQGNSIFHRHICSDLINLLFSYGGRLKAKNNNGLTPLMKSVCRNNLQIFKTLLTLGANPNCHDNDFNTALQKSTNESFANLLIYHGADITAANRYNRPNWNSLASDDSFHLGNIAIFKFSLLAKNENFIKSIVTSDQSDWLHLYLEKCKTEINRMKEMFVIDKKFTFYDLCVLKMTKNNKFVNVSKKEYKLAYKNIDLYFNNFNEFIKIRLNDNKFEKYKFDLIIKFNKLSILPIFSSSNDYSNLNFDCLFEICQKHLNLKEVYNLFLASLL